MLKQVELIIQHDKQGFSAFTTVRSIYLSIYLCIWTGLRKEHKFRWQKLYHKKTQTHKICKNACQPSPPHRLASFFAAVYIFRCQVYNSVQICLGYRHKRKKIK